MVNKIVLSVFVTLILFFNLQAGDGRLDKKGEVQFFEAFKTCVEKVKTLKVSFSQKRHMAIFTETLDAGGKCFFKYPDKLRWEINKPYKSIMVYNGDSIAKFDFDDGVYRKMNSGNYDMLMEVLSQINAWMKGDFSKTGNTYDLTVFRNGEDFRIELLPKDKSMKKFLQSVELFARGKDYHITRVVIRENAEDFIEINFSGEKINTGFPDDFFNTEELKDSKE